MPIALRFSVFPCLRGESSSALPDGLHRSVRVPALFVYPPLTREAPQASLPLKTTEKAEGTKNGGR